MLLHDRFEIAEAEDLDSDGPLDGNYRMGDLLTGSRSKRFAQEQWAFDQAERTLAREAIIPWDEIDSYDFFLSPISRASVTVYAYDSDGGQVEIGSRYASLVMVGHSHDEAEVVANVERWLCAVGHPELKRRAVVLAERERKLEELATTPINPSLRTRRSPLAIERAAA